MLKRCVRLCVDAFAGSAEFDRLACPSYAHLLAPSLRSDSSLACLWGSTRSALANSLHGASHRRTASGNCSLGATPYRKKYIPSGTSYRERNRLRKPPARTQGRCGRSSVLVHNSGAFGTPSRRWNAHPNGSVPARGPTTRYSPPDRLPPDIN